MKLTELKQQKGTYAAVKFSDQTKGNIADYMAANDIPNPLPIDKMHTTLLYSRKYLPDYEPAGKYSNPMVGTPEQFEVWESSPDEDGNRSMCLVLKFKCPELEARHEHLMKEHGATYDYDEYKTHITFSYNVGDMKVDNLPKFESDIEVVSEYGEDLNLSWAKDNS